jgi:hypothetical protein
MKSRAIIQGVIAGLAVLGGSVVAQQTPAVFAASPHLAISAAHQVLTVNGSHFSTSGRTVSLYAYGLVGTRKVFMTSAHVTPLRTTPFRPSPPAPPCLLGVLCAAGGFRVNMWQPHDPCVRGGYWHVEVDAWTTGPLGNRYEAAAARATVTCPPPVGNPK